MTAPVALELRRVRRGFGDVLALDAMDLTVRRGTVHALLGENGAGKTTAMRIAYGILKPDAGEIIVDGIARAFAAPSDAIATGIGMVQQHPANVGALTVWENVMLGGKGRLDARAARRAVGALARDLGFALDPDGRVSDLSVASQQRLEILKSINRKARILILDEPTAILAPREANDLYVWLRAFAAGGGTVVVVTHKLDEARRFTDDLTVLRRGKTVFQASSPATAAEALTQAMIGEALVMPAEERHSANPGEPVLEAQGVTVHDARNVPAVRNATFAVRAGEIVGVAGVEGSGHHELLLAIAGRLRVHSGELKRPAAVAIVAEDRHRDGVVLDFSLLENDALRGAGTRRGPIPWKENENRVATMIRRFDVRASGPRAVMQTLSGGNQQKFVLARELDAQPELIVAENPTRGLDIRAAAFVRDELRAARGRGAAVVVYTSDLDELLDLADRVLVLHAGEVVETPRDRARIGAAMLGAA